MAIKTQEQTIPSPSELENQQSKNFTTEEINELKSLQSEINQLTLSFGQLHLSKIKLKEQETFLRDKLKDLEASESKLAKSLTAKYGKGSLDIDTGKFTPSE